MLCWACYEEVEQLHTSVMKCKVVVMCAKGNVKLFVKIKNVLTFAPANPLLAIYSTNVFTCLKNTICIKIFIIVLFVMIRCMNQPLV